MNYLFIVRRPRGNIHGVLSLKLRMAIRSAIIELGNIVSCLNSRKHQQLHRLKSS